MRKKTAGRLAPPPPQHEFDALPLSRLSGKATGVFHRLHSLDRKSGHPWPPLHFSCRGTTRFDPANGIGTLCVARTLAGALMEVVDDQWGPVGSLGRSVTQRQLTEWWVTLVSIPEVELLDLTGANLSKLGTDAQLLTGDYAITREWALRMMRHPQQVGGLLYASRHDPQRKNVALFQRAALLPAVEEGSLHPTTLASWVRKRRRGPKLACGPAILLRDHPELARCLADLEVAVLP